MVAFADTSIRAYTSTPKNAYPRFHDAILSTKYFDDETELAYYGYRYYSPEMGRFINRDPIGEKGGYDLYSFVANKPVRYYDYLGMWFRRRATTNPEDLLKKSCEEASDRFLNANPDWDTAITEAKQNCNLDIACKRCCPRGEERKWHRYDFFGRLQCGDEDPQTGKRDCRIRVCWDLPFTEAPTYEQIFAHEYTHFLDKCWKKPWWSPCSTRHPGMGLQSRRQRKICGCAGCFCREVRAFHMTGVQECDGSSLAACVDEIFRRGYWDGSCSAYCPGQTYQFTQNDVRQYLLGANGGCSFSAQLPPVPAW